MAIFIREGHFGVLVFFKFCFFFFNFVNKMLRVGPFFQEGRVTGTTHIFYFGLICIGIQLAWLT